MQTQTRLVRRITATPNSRKSTTFVVKGAGSEAETTTFVQKQLQEKEMQTLTNLTTREHFCF